MAGDCRGTRPEPHRVSTKLRFFISRVGVEETTRCQTAWASAKKCVSGWQVIAAGHDLNPTAYVRRGGTWSEGGKLDDSKVP